MNAGIIFVLIFAVMSVIAGFTLIFSQYWFQYVGFGLTMGIMFTQIVETFHDRKYDDDFQNPFRCE